MIPASYYAHVLGGVDKVIDEFSSRCDVVISAISCG